MKPYLLEAQCEFLSLLRTPRFSLPTLILPAMFYSFFALVLPTGKFSSAAAAQLLDGQGVFGVLQACLWGIGAGIATDRGLGFVQIKRASPMPPLAYLFAKLASALIFSTIILASLIALGTAFGGVRLSPTQLALFAVTVLSGVIPFGALGIVLGHLAGAKSATGIINLFTMPMALVSGLWMPIDYLPPVFHTFAQALPTYHLAEIGRTIIGRPANDTVAYHAVMMIIFTLALGALAALLIKREQARAYD